ncbi:succinate dehydrogenase assembly factor 2 [Giesbergeria anulus]|uniref:FAD assembly factor SdhE n=1 Tax=Giesbergeria anulus TaxID=180197 RepID=A0A1H9R8C6_9BURK|nr:succinate dehydrogenase assembly factor 2 [Giesbergeria anulus]SER68309.1 antitoxin CptB [Giesbergeria anulus]
MGETPSSCTAAALPLLDERAVSKLRWRCRRGMVENDLFIERFFTRFASQLNQRHADGMNALMDLADNDLLDLLLWRREPEGALNTEEVREVLGMMRQGGSGALAPAH